MPKGDGNRNKGAGLKWILEHVNYQGDDCLIWPLSRDPDYGRGQVGYQGRKHWAHRVMCELAHGPAPEGKPQAAHNCGNGHLGCCNPRHLEWKDNSDNQHDRRLHGRTEGANGRLTHLTPTQVAEIRKAKGKVPQFTLARLLGVKRGTIEYWQRTTHEPFQPSTNKYNIARRKHRRETRTAQ